MLRFSRANLAKFKPSRKAILVMAIALACGSAAFMLLNERVACVLSKRSQLIENEYEMVPERAGFAAWKRCGG